MQRRGVSLNMRKGQNESYCVFLRIVSFHVENGGSCALLGNRDSPTLEMQFFVTIVYFVLSVYETRLITR